MAKYRGKHEGKIRGKYVCKAFRSEQENREDNEHLGSSLENYLATKGYGTCWAEGVDTTGGEKKSFGSYSFHVGGATVSVARKDLEEGVCGRAPNFTEIKLVSNDSLDDIAEMILDKFPSFKEVKFR